MNELSLLSCVVSSCYLVFRPQVSQKRFSLTQEICSDLNLCSCVHQLHTELTSHRRKRHLNARKRKFEIQ